MTSPSLYQNSRTYDFFIRLLGYESGIDRFLRDLEIDCDSDCRILDAGCGTGLLGLHFINRFSAATLLATDLEPNFLPATIANAERRGIESKRITVGCSNISTPQKVTTLDDQLWELEDASFDLICVGAVLGYADDTEVSIRLLLRLLAPGGYLVNVEMNESIVGRFISHCYRYHNLSIARMRDVIRAEGCEVFTRKLRMSHLPAKLTRTAIIAVKPGG